jgi:hypothetical protein
MYHLITCPKCNTGQLFEYGDVTKKCRYEKCDGYEWTIEYTNELLRKIIEDYRKVEASRKPFKMRAFKQPHIQRFDDFYMAVPSVI